MTTSTTAPRPPAPSITDINAMTNLETWETTTASSVVVNRYTRGGGEKGTLVGGKPGQRIQVTTAEREELNEERAAAPDTDIFRNGFLRPVRNVPAEVLERFESETKEQGGLTVEDMMAILEMKGATFKTRVDKLNEAALRRLASLAPEADATASQLQVIEDALEKYKVTIRQTETDKALRAGPDGGSGAD